MRQIILPLMLCLALAGCAGKQDVKNTWKFTVKQYRTYLNTPAKLDMEYTPSTSDYENVLVESIINMDLQLEKLQRTMENSSKDIGQEWVLQMMDDFPWLSGLAMVDSEGNTITRYPDYYVKGFDVGPLLEEDPKQKTYALRAYVQTTPFGSEVYLGSPVYIDNVFRGMIVVHFDPKSLLSYSPDPGLFMVASPSGVLWHGNFGGAGNPVAHAEWEKILLKDSKGYIKGEGEEFYWIARYLGNLPLVYALPVKVSQ